MYANMACFPYQKTIFKLNDRRIANKKMKTSSWGPKKNTNSAKIFMSHERGTILTIVRHKSCDY